jgi:chemotaxis protein MotC
MIVLAASRLAAAEDASGFVEMVRELNSVQNRMVAGDAAARAAAPGRIAKIEQALPSFSPEDWKQTRNARAAAVYLLCGGSPRTLRRLFDARVFLEESAPLLAGSLAYAEGHGSEAAKHLSALEAKRLPANLGGHLALVQGGLSIGADNARAIAHFDMARLLLPGSLVEEAALRREIMILEARTQSQKLLMLAKRYVSKYPSSPFAKSFWAGFEKLLIGNALNVDIARLAELEEIVEALAPSSRLDIHFEIARKAILNGRLDVATAEIAKAERLVETPADHARAKFYDSLMKAMSGDFSEGWTALQKSDPNALSPSDGELRRIVTSAVARLQEVSSAEPPSSTDASARAGQPSEDAAINERPIVDVVRQGLERSDELLQKASRQ